MFRLARRLIATVHATVHAAVRAAVQAVVHPAVADDDGQATTEYALVLLGAALIALLVVGWATTGGGAGRIGDLFNRVIDSVTEEL